MRASRSLKFQILAYFMAVVGLVSLTGLLVLYTGGRMVFEEWVLRSNRFLARAVERHLGQGLARGTSAAAALAGRLAACKSETSETARLLEDFLLFNDLFANAYLFGPDGKVRAWRYRAGAESHSDHVGEDYHRYPGMFSAAADQVLAGGKAGFTPVFYSSSGRPQIAYLHPIAGADGRVAGLLSLALYAVSEQVNGWISGLELGRNGYIAVLDRNGRALALTGKVPVRLSATNVRPLLDFAGLGSEEMGSIEMDGREDLVFQQMMPELGFRIWVGLPEWVAYRPLRSFQMPAALALLAALLLGLSGAFIVVRRLLGPLGELVQGIRRVGDGVLSHRVPIVREDELGEAAAAFNRMAEQLHRDQLLEEVWREVRKV